MNRQMTFRECLRRDHDHYLQGSFYGGRGVGTRRKWRTMVKSILDIDFRVVLWYRLSALLWRRGYRWMALLIHYRLKSRYSVEIHPGVLIGPGLRFVHGFSIVIGSNVKMGMDVVVFGQTVIGKSRPDLPGDEMPEIGDRVLLGAGCKVLGRVQIPSNRLVPANAVVTANGLRNNPDMLVVLHPEGDEGRT